MRIYSPYQSLYRSIHCCSTVQPDADPTLHDRGTIAFAAIGDGGSHSVDSYRRTAGSATDFESIVLCLTNRRKPLASGGRHHHPPKNVAADKGAKACTR